MTKLAECGITGSMQSGDARALARRLLEETAQRAIGIYHSTQRRVTRWVEEPKFNILPPLALTLLAMPAIVQATAPAMDAIAEGGQIVQSAISQALGSGPIAKHAGFLVAGAGVASEAILLYGAPLVLAAGITHGAKSALKFLQRKNSTPSIS